jgi:flagellar basal-body rod protein FlgG
MMDRSMITATNTMSGLQKQIDTIGNNMANLDTTGYKRRNTSFSELLTQEFQNQPDLAKEVGRNTPNGIRGGVGATLGQTFLNMAQGSIKSTDRMLDIAFTNDSQFLKIMVEENGNRTSRLTRDGALYLSPHGSGKSILVTSEGNPILDENNQTIEINDQFKEIKIADNGIMTVTGNNGKQTGTYNLQVVQVKRPQMLLAKGNNQFELPTNLGQLNLTEADVITPLNGNLRNTIAIKQSALEQSNVDLSKEMSDLLLAQRSYEFNAKSISIADQMLGLINGVR